jgi:UDP-N-acetyl-D-glucosamine dehydrogenase
MNYPTKDVVAVVGLGYVGLPTAMSLVESGKKVIGFDISVDRLTRIASCDVDLSSEDLGRLTSAIESGKLELTIDTSRLPEAEAVIICVPTPVDESMAPDFTAIHGACAAVVERACPGQTIILTSTTYVGSTRDLVVEPLAARGLVAGSDVFVAFSPERIDPGVTAHTPLTTPRVVGGATPACTEHATAVLAATAATVHTVSSPDAAEMAKLLENTFRAVNIAFANEFAEIAESLDLSIGEVIDAAATKPYGFMRFTPGPGVGGHCIPCDPHYLLWQLRRGRQTAPITEIAMRGIAQRPSVIVDKVRTRLANTGKPLVGARVHVVGVAYKPGVADVRESPALEIMSEMIRAGALVTYSDSHVPSVTIDGKRIPPSSSEAAESADLVLIHTIHPGETDWWTAFSEVNGRPEVLDVTYRSEPHINANAS